ncbi:MAG: phage head-tail connector protein [Lachnospiraceae bacterium]|nr:phage head-tail connector protein [Clostridia bacterium]MBR0085648.1 phage head-tail connector protein [Lachnospiraceae bacterium]
MDGNIYTLLGLDESNEEVQNKIEAIVDLTESRLKNLLGGVDAIPGSLEYIVTEVSIMRYNRIGSEGASSHNVEGESLSWANDNDFDAFRNDIEAYLEEQSKDGRGKVRFI